MTSSASLHHLFPLTLEKLYYDGTAIAAATSLSPPPPEARHVIFAVKATTTLLLTILDFFHTFCLSQNVIDNLPGFPGKLPFKLGTGYIGVGEKEEVQLFYYFFASERNPEEDPLMLWLTGGPGCSSLYGVANEIGFPGKLPFKLETGYIGVGEKEDVQLFYYFFESESSPEKDPLMLWLTGGPGWSSLYGVANEIGPFTIDFLNSNGSLPSLMLREHAWTKVANVIFLDQPVGTGFSYATTPEAYYSGDTYAMELDYEFLRQWLKNHPKYINNPLYIGGDSYSGIPVPLIVNNVYRGNEGGIKPLLNIKGYILGNPYTDAFGEINERVPYAHRMGLLFDRLYHSAKVNCHGNYVNVNLENVLCLNDLERINQCLDKLNEFMILEPSCDSVWRTKEEVLSSAIPFSGESPTNFLQLVVAPVEKIMCRDAAVVHLHTWANNKSVRQALDIREGTKGEWTRCNETIRSGAHASDVTAPYVCNVKSVAGYHQDFTHKKCRALIYSGNHDKAFPQTSTEKWIEFLKVPVLSDWRPWFVQGQIAGYTVTYGHGDYELTYATVKGAAHLPPEYKPEECFAMITRWFDKSYL